MTTVEAFLVEQARRGITVCNWSWKPSNWKLRNWLINLLLLVLATALVLALSEGLLRWLDGYQMSTLKLNQDNTTIPTPDQSR